ncbi:MAG: type II secretion system protein [Candidatus Omnitrophica bacterium]|nr:type II secretion system protein [Candidatus Omnitrophota bacterium]
MKKIKGFTLVELMIVMVIIGILLSLLLPGVFTAQKSALDTQTASNLRQVGIALFAYAKDSGGNLPAAATLNDALVAVDGSLYLDDPDVLDNAAGDAMTYNYAVLTNLYTLTSSNALMTDDHATSGSGQSVFADGHVSK